MIKEGDRVAPFNKMSLTGTVVEMKRVKSSEWFVGGVPGDRFVAKVLLDESRHILEISADDLMRLE